MLTRQRLADLKESDSWLAVLNESASALAVNKQERERIGEETLWAD